MFGKKLGQMGESISKMRDMKKQMSAVQKRIALIRVTASAGAGMVDVTATGDGVISNVKINKSMFEGDDMKMLEGLVVSAVNEAITKSKEAMAHEMKAITGGMDLNEMAKMFGGGE